MIENFKVSVIIPVYNAGEFVEKATLSALNLECVGEIILVEDGSTDDSYKRCFSLSQQFSKVKLLTHKYNQNRGVSDSRNLGLLSASFEFVSFLDADDYFLPNRFDQEMILLENSDIDGVYNAVKSVCLSPDYQDLFVKAKEPELLTLNKYIDPDDLFESLIWQNNGQFHISGLTVRKRVFKKAGIFISNLVGEDTHLFYRISGTSRLVPGIIESPVAHRVIHNSNSIHTTKSKLAETQKGIALSMVSWISSENQLSYNRIVTYFSMLNCYSRIFTRPYPTIVFWSLVGIRFPVTLFKSFYWMRTGQIIRNMIFRKMKTANRSIEEWS